MGSYLVKWILLSIYAVCTVSTHDNFTELVSLLCLSCKSKHKLDVI